MLRVLMIVFTAAALGSLVATLALSAILGGTGSPNPVRFVFALSAATMMFTVPGALMLAGLQFFLRERGVGSGSIAVIVAIWGAVAGGIILGLNFVVDDAAVGALYGLTTAVTFLATERLLGERKAGRG